AGTSRAAGPETTQTSAVPAASEVPEPTALPAAPLGEAPAPAPPGIARREARAPVILPPVEVSSASASLRIATDERPRRAGAPPAPPARAKTYARTATLPSGKLELDGIVYSETNPTALINGRVLSPGGYVAGYTVVKIEHDRVELTDDGTTIVLTLK
ncbi:MAG: hypothetical protein ACRD3M_18360, partial [Thermoanaerobaculia bacterium]